MELPSENEREEGNQEEKVNEGVGVNMEKEVEIDMGIQNLRLKRDESEMKEELGEKQKKRFRRMIVQGGGEVEYVNRDE